MAVHMDTDGGRSPAAFVRSLPRKRARTVLLSPHPSVRLHDNDMYRPGHGGYTWNVLHRHIDSYNHALITVVLVVVNRKNIFS